MLDALRWPDDEALSADVCIVGAGAAGISLAMELADRGIDVLLLEAGGTGPEPRTQALYSGEVSDPHLHSSPDRYRERRFGGTTTVWAGRCAPLDPIDFERRDYLPNSGWPIGSEALAPYYPRANRMCEAGEFAYTVDAAFARPLPAMIPGFSGQSFTDSTLERFSCPTDFGARYAERLRAHPNLQVMLHANVTSLQLRPDGKAVRHALVQTLNGRRLKVHANRFVLAAGGLEVARLLLASRDVQPAGIGNGHDCVGRYYMCHVAGTLGFLQFNGEPAWHGYDVDDEGVYCRRRLALSPDSQRHLRIGNFIARLHHPRITDPAHGSSVLSALYFARPLVPFEYASRLYGDEVVSWRQQARHLFNLFRAPQKVLGFAWHMLRDRRLATRKYPSLIVQSPSNCFSVDFHAEQEPQPESRVTLAEGCDALGMPRLKIDWRYSPGDVRTVSRAVAALAEDIRLSGVGRLSYQPDEIEREITRYGAYGGHHLGTARMGSDPRHSVVDSDCRVHGVDNLYVASGAVFPTSSQANPTLTVVALALRLAEHLEAVAVGDGAECRSPLGNQSFVERTQADTRVSTSA